MQFRTLTASEIEARIGQVKENGLTLLLYKNARVDMDILDETVGAEHWMRAHSRDNANCTVSIWIPELNQWVSKEDTGTESNTEAEKGLASDSFKRACVNWGIGRELYTAPFIWIKAADCSIQNRKCYDKFSVCEIEYDDKRRITDLSIRNEKTGRIVYEHHAGKKQKPTAPPPIPKQEQPPQDADHGAMRNRLNKIVITLSKGDPASMAQAYNIWSNGKYNALDEIPDGEIANVLHLAENIYRKRGFTD